ncbi:DUF4007 family protein [Candidatus Methylobacter oryzae]|uniref:DUF4007 family protein n=1 Tax=Candidatus Methylobacter oryzae TaxID=2497749 RepID=A0ABY3CBJ3_9GAMM|nr:DUF4007 family protein [Candidatus Methylobacter oryzae]TRW96452.1 DUF4007 family protein [Candidatus Methylobacter oryzae]
MESSLNFFHKQKASFGRHEAFALRYSWLTKGFQAFDNKAFFASPDKSTIELGVGKNMVNVIKYYCRNIEPKIRFKGMVAGGVFRFGEIIIYSFSGAFIGGSGKSDKCDGWRNIGVLQSCGCWQNHCTYQRHQCFLHYALNAGRSESFAEESFNSSIGSQKLSS